jgi:nickel-type superoxide dismutase maturation protease
MVLLWVRSDTIAVRLPLRRVLVEGPSMVPALRHGDQVLVWWVRRPRPRPGAIVVVDLPQDRGLGIKRVREVRPDGSMWVEGDNPLGSTDSRQFGLIGAPALRGRVLLRLWPRPARIGAAKSPGVAP